MHNTSKIVSNNKIFSWLLGSVFLDHLSLNTVTPILTLVFFDLTSPLFLPDASLLTRSLWYGCMASLYHISNIIATPLLGVISDHSGRRFILMLGAVGALLMACSGVLSIGFGLVSLLLFGRLIGGLCATRAVSQAAVSDLPTQSSKLAQMGYLQATIAFAAFAAPLLGSYAAQHSPSSPVNFSAPFYLAAFIALLSLWIVIAKLPETHHERAPYQLKVLLRNTRKNFLRRDILHISLLMFFSQAGWSLYYQYIPPILKKDFNFSVTQLGWFISLIALWLVLAASVGMKFLHKRMSPLGIIQLASWISLAGLVMTLAALHFQHLEHYSFLWLAALPVAAGDVLAYSVFTSLYANAASPREQGLVMGVCVIVAQTVWALTGIIGGALFGIHISLPIWIAVFSIVILLILLRR